MITAMGRAGGIRPQKEARARPRNSGCIQHNRRHVAQSVRHLAEPAPSLDRVDLRRYYQIRPLLRPIFLYLILDTA